MGSHWVLTLLYLKNVIYWPEDDRLRSKYVVIMWPECIYNITALIYSCVLTEYNTLYKLNKSVGFRFFCGIRLYYFREPAVFCPYPNWDENGRHPLCCLFKIHADDIFQLGVPVGLSSSCLCVSSISLSCTMHGCPTLLIYLTINNILYCRI